MCGRDAAGSSGRFERTRMLFGLTKRRANLVSVSAAISQIGLAWLTAECVPRAAERDRLGDYLHVAQALAIHSLALKRSGR
jgi:hypothetical protein